MREHFLGGHQVGRAFANEALGVGARGEVASPERYLGVRVREHVIVLSGPGDVLVAIRRNSVNILAGSRILKFNVSEFSVEALDQLVKRSKILTGVGVPEVVAEDHEEVAGLVGLVVRSLMINPLTKIHHLIVEVVGLHGRVVDYGIVA